MAELSKDTFPDLEGLLRITSKDMIRFIEIVKRFAEGRFFIFDNIEIYLLGIHLISK